MGLITKDIGTCLSERAGLTPELIGLSDPQASYTWRDIDVITDLLARLFLEQGIGPKTHVAIWGVNSPNWVFTYYALQKVGAVAILLNSSYNKAELAGVLEETDVEVLLYGELGRGVAGDEILAEMVRLKLLKPERIIAMEAWAEAGEAWYTAAGLRRQLGLTPEAAAALKPRPVDAHQTACILFTSGTTSRPKGVMLSHYSLVNNSRQIALAMEWKEHDKLCLAVPLYHCFGITAGILTGLHTGAGMHLLKRCKTSEMMEHIETYRCTVLNGVPTMFLALVRNPRRAEFDLSSLRSGVLAGSAILPQEYLEVCKKLAMPYLQPSYGQTESSPCITIAALTDDRETKAHHSGQIIPDVEVKIWDPANHCEVKAGEIGEILTRGYHVMQGYYGREAETQQVIDSDGWLHTGDLGYLDPLNRLCVTGRIKELIIRGGENIAPVEIEACISQMPEVAQVKAVGIPAAVIQEEIAVCIIQKPGCQAAPEAVRAFVRARLAEYKIPKYVLYFDTFPTSENGKIKTGQLKELAFRMASAAD